MSRRVYIHVGAPKTGTTYLQDRLRLNRGTLAEHGVHYPLGPLGLHAAHFRPALDLIELDWGGARARAEGQWDALMRRVRRSDGTVVISHEILATATQEQIARAMRDLDGSDIHVVYSARDLARQIPAEWQESIKQGRKWTYRKFLRTVRSRRQQQSDMWFWRVQGLPDVLTRWGAGLEPDHVHLVTVPRSGAPRDLLWERFCRVFGIDPAWAPRETEAGNPSMGTAEVTLVRRLNKRLKDSGLTPDDHRYLVKELLVQQHLAHRKSEKATLPPRLFPWAEEVTERWIEWIEGSGIDVVGDVDELRPVRPPEDLAWVNPDRPRPKAVVDAALDALEVMTVEASRREHPEEQLTGKVRKAARRLRGE